jgi:hypothetical protein
MFLGHIGVGLAAKQVAPKVPVIILILAAEVLDILFVIFWLIGIEKSASIFSYPSIPWSHGLFMSVIWSMLAVVAGVLIYRNYRSGVVIGLLVFGHWVLDFISHPMGIGNHLPDLPLLFEWSPKVGLGFYNSLAGILIGEFGLFILGIFIYIRVVKAIKFRPDPHVSDNTSTPIRKKISS